MTPTWAFLREEFFLDARVFALGGILGTIARYALQGWVQTRAGATTFPLGTLTRREVAAYLVSEALGWEIVPGTLLRDGPHGEGMLQRWIEVDETADVIDMVNGDDPRLRRIAVFDAIVNNTDRKAGHLLPVPGGHL